MTQLQAGEFAEFYAANFHRIAAPLRAYLGDHTEAQDLTQEAFCRALERWQRINGYDNPLAWVRQVAWNLATSRLRHLRVARRFVARQREEHVPSPGPERVDIARALAMLPPNQRLAVVLHHVGHLSTAEIAEQQGVAEGTVRSWLSRGRAKLAETLIDWDQAAIDVSPPRAGDVDAVVAKVKRRRTTRRATVAVAIAIGLTVPLVLVVTRGGEPPVITPTPPPSQSPTPSPTPSPVSTRRISLPGLTFAVSPEVVFVDARNAWLWYDSCRNGGINSTCVYTMAATSDGGQTWRTIKPPAVPQRSSVAMFVSDANTVTLQVTEERNDTPAGYWFTKDGGATFTSYPLKRPPVEAVKSQQGGDYAMLCPGATGLEDGAWGIECDRRELVKLGSGRVAKQPPVQGQVLNGADGRLWVFSEGSGKRRLFLSEDNASTWKELPLPPVANPGYPRLSPDGKQLWIVADDFWELVGGQWVKRTRSYGPHSTYLGDGLWLVSGLNYFKDGVLTRIPGVPADGGYVLRDGTIVARAGDDLYLGIGSGMNRHWIRITR